MYRRYFISTVAPYVHIILFLRVLRQSGTFPQFLPRIIPEMVYVCGCIATLSRKESPSDMLVDKPLIGPFKLDFKLPKYLWSENMKGFHWNLLQCNTYCISLILLVVNMRENLTWAFCPSSLQRSKAITLCCFTLVTKCNCSSLA